MSGGTTGRGSMTLPSTLASVSVVEETALKFALNIGFDPDTASNLAMVAREAVVNAVVHGNRYHPDKHVVASFEFSTDAMTIKVSDEGEGMDESLLPDPLAPENLLRSSGRGIFLIRAFMDEVHFRKLGPGTEITLVKHRITGEK